MGAAPPSDRPLARPAEPTRAATRDAPTGRSHPRDEEALSPSQRPGAASAQSRIHVLDLARSLALLAMIGFHFGVDLELFGLAPAGMTRQGGWWWAARLIAGSFLFLAGVSLWLAHGQRLRWAAFWRRQMMVMAAALAVTLGTLIVMPNAFVHFGILHSIALSSLIGLAFLRMPALVTLATAALVFWIGNTQSIAAFDHPLLWWTGLAPQARPSLDFEPILPWLAAFLLGLGLARLADSAGLWSALRGKGPAWLATLGWPGRQSLVIYLSHQPLLFALFLAARWLGLI